MGSANASPALRAIEPLSTWTVMFVAAASPQEVGAYRICHILGIADAAKKTYLPLVHLLVAESREESGVTLVKPFASHRSFSPCWVEIQMRPWNNWHEFFK